jgi:hypothetical protein
MKYKRNDPRPPSETLDYGLGVGHAHCRVCNEDATRPTIPEAVRWASTHALIHAARGESS